MDTIIKIQEQIQSVDDKIAEMEKTTLSLHSIDDLGRTAHRIADQIKSLSEHNSLLLTLVGENPSGGVRKAVSSMRAQYTTIKDSLYASHAGFMGQHNKAKAELQKLNDMKEGQAQLKEDFQVSMDLLTLALNDSNKFVASSLNVIRQNREQNKGSK